MINQDKKQLLKFLGGGLIITVAFGIMAPGVVSYVMGLWRLISLIATIVSVAFLVVFVYHRLKPKREESTSYTEEATEPQDDIEP
jgi:uncharacterized membrane protein